MAAVIERAREFIRSGHPRDQSSLLRDLLADGGTQSLAATVMLAEDMYDGITFNFEMKAPAAVSLVAFGVPGLEAIAEMAVRTPTSKNQSLCLDILGSVAAGVVPINGMFIRDPAVLDKVTRVASEPSMSPAARAVLRAYVLGLADDVDAARLVGTGLGRLGWRSESDDKVAGELFVALAGRRIAIGSATIAEFDRLIHEVPDEEPRFHSFFERHPQLLDPAVVEVWSKPDFAGHLEPDFVLRRVDDTYLVVEIETPAKPMVTRGNQMSSLATQAIAQVTSYGEFLMQDVARARAFFPRLSQPDCLVVIGLEGALAASQSTALARDNASRSRLRVVGFDWVRERANAVTANVIEPRLTQQSVRIY